ncbi:MAG: MmcQ/YjbR family DNA-binding protein [Clostridium sp.]|nr:MmcQ/YjbR family DNA-binding protein [Clostridium sp.]MCM1398668.1 MmcQ/YjbR family DNA-binding protein [Clostridium sp.]MCM1458701.1 MmcQ/YjbR family DNA-binding protein [Bacteroides sp.]
MFEEVFKRKKLNVTKLPAYGFKEADGNYTYETNIMDDSFLLHITINKMGMVDTFLTDVESGEEYTLYKTNALGAFVGEVRLKVEEVLLDIADKCYSPEVFKAKQSKALIDYVRERYGDELEFLWPTSPENAIWRRKDNKKWYGVLLSIPRCKLGIDSQEVVEVVDLRAEPEKLERLVDGKRYFPGWHMNKKHWFTIILDESVSDDELFQRIDASYALDDRKS